MSQHLALIAKKADCLLAAPGAMWPVDLKEVFILLCSATVRLRLKYWACPHSSQFNRDVEKLERVQKRATRMVTGPEHMT